MGKVYRGQFQKKMLIKLGKLHALLWLQEPNNLRLVFTADLSKEL